MKSLQCCAPRFERFAGQRLACIVHQEIENYEFSRMRFRQSPDAAFRGMNSLQQIVKGKASVYRENQFSVQRELRRFHFQQRGGNFRKISRQRLRRLRLQFNFFPAAKCQASESVSVLPSIAEDFSIRYLSPDHTFIIPRLRS